MKIHIRNDERVIFAGRTGSGKTVLAKHFLTRLNRVLAIDPKHTLKLDGFSRRRGLPIFGAEFRIIYRPRLEDDYDLARILQAIMRGKHATVYCDELATLTEMYPYATAQLADLARTGRERHVAVWCATQRPRWIPRVFFTEAEVVFMFNMRGADDRAYMAQFIGPEAFDPIDKYEFWYSHADETETGLMRLDLNKNYIERIG